MIRRLTIAEFEAFWPQFLAANQFHPTYALQESMSVTEAYRYWCEYPRKAFVMIEEGRVMGTYYLRNSGIEPSCHCECGFIICEWAKLEYIISQFSEHALHTAVLLGHYAIHFVMVAYPNKRAVEAWEKEGFHEIGMMPKGYNHPFRGRLDCYIMRKYLLPLAG